MVDVQVLPLDDVVKEEADGLIKSLGHIDPMTVNSTSDLITLRQSLTNAILFLDNLIYKEKLIYSKGN